MKHNKFIFTLIIILIITVLISCGDSRVIVAEFGFDDMNDSMASLICDVNTLEAVTELSSHIALVRVIGQNSVELNDLDEFSFEYDVEILELLLNVGDTLKVGDRIDVVSSKGYLKASTAAALVAKDATARKYGAIKGEFTDNDYIAASNWNAVPIDVGRTYIMFLTDEFFENEGVYADSGRSFLYEYSGQRTYVTRKRVLGDSSKDNILNTIKAQISARTGRADEVGSSQYMTELGARQEAERAKQYE